MQKLLVLAFLVAWGAAALCAPAVTVGPEGSLQAAIDAAPAGAVIQLTAGTWRENLVIAKPLVLRGQGADATQIAAAEPGTPVITVSSPQTISVTLEGVRITGGTGDCADPSLGTCPHGILASGRVHLSLISCEIVGNASCGLFATQEADVTVTETDFTNNQTGLWVHSRARARVRGGRTSGNVYGLIASGQAELVVEGTQVTGNLQDGILAGDGARVYLWDCEIAGNGRIGICLDIPGCYRTSRAFTGLVRGAGNTVPGSDDPTANKLAPFCPRDLAFLRSRLGGIYPPPDVDALLERLSLPLPPLGSPEAPLTMLEFSDFSCPYCARFALETLPQLREEYIDSGRVRLYFLPFPVHGEAAKVEAEAAFCAAAQGLYWEFQKAAFSYAEEHGYPELGGEALALILGSVGGDPEGLLACLSSGTYAETVEQTIAIARELGVRGTPTFFVGQWTIPGAYPYPVFQGIIDHALGGG